MLLNLDPDIVRSRPRLHSTCSKQFVLFTEQVIILYMPPVGPRLVNQ
jgi:uncharacterized protein YqhQ